ncbi:MAG TPA: bifunctional alpha,alpha-trehalose-phosphate synthase (UDP-forming)/trehalose-phosphatase [Tepidisphaeraceae bacterium]|nr:bifunctional alpha,alpha-trehalose-phosphate synthase (UDP-forming)/trehalose-phosphatase [Tepidisphaeraceae bacterium]
MPGTIINVSNRLPITIEGDQIKKSSGGLVTALEAVSGGRYELKWIGWTGEGCADATRQRGLEERFTREFGFVPVFMTQAEQAGFYEGFSNSSIWPLLHYLPSYMRYDDAQWWHDYRNVNQRFADAVLRTAKDGDLVWVHDYQLMLVPAMLRAANPSLRTGFFLHTPFPSYEIFRCHPHRVDLIEGLLGADQIGFHTFGYARHFRSAVVRLLGIDAELMRIRRDGHTSHLGVYPIGINAAKFEEELNTQQHRAQCEHFRANFAHKRVVLSVERMDYTKGILRRLQAIDQFLAANADKHDEMKFIFISVPSRERVEEYQDLLSEVESQIGRLNGRYATINNSPIHFIHGTVTFTELCALYALAEVAMVTPLRDGMNLVAKEYVAAQRDGAGVLVLSEFAGAAEELFNAIVVNPYDAQGVAAYLREALEMPLEQRRERMRPMRDRVMKFDASWWATSFIDDLAALELVSSVAPDIDDAQRRVASAVADNSKRVVLFLDYDGTLREIVKDPGTATVTTEMRWLFDRLRRLENVDVTIISGRTPQDLDAFVGEFPFGLIAEHGAALCRPGSSDWEQLDRNVSYAWKEELLRVLQLYEASTPGSRVEEKRTSLVWHYRQADPEFGHQKAMDLAEELSTIAANDPVQIRHGRKIVEVTASHVNKGAAVARLLSERQYDLILAAGDDTTDESMFRLDLQNFITIRVGDGDTLARYRLPTPAALRAFLARSLP